MPVFPMYGESNKIILCKKNSCGLHFTSLKLLAAVPGDLSSGLRTPKNQSKAGMIGTVGWTQEESGTVLPELSHSACWKGGGGDVCAVVCV